MMTFANGICRRGHAGDGAQHWHDGGGSRWKKFFACGETNEPLFRSQFLTPLANFFAEIRNLTCLIAHCNYSMSGPRGANKRPPLMCRTNHGVSSEMAHLVQQKGWKPEYCPSKFIPCSRHQRPEVTSAQRETRLEKISGCNCLIVSGAM